jgi:RNA polymerase sigma-70 factor (ECF subfamily)
MFVVDSTQLAATRFDAVVAEYGPALTRLARGYEADADRQRDLVQEIHVAIWRALPTFEGRSSLRTFVFRVAHNVAVTHVVRGNRDQLARCVSLDELPNEREPVGSGAGAEARDQLRQLDALVRALRPLERQIIVLYLEGCSHAEISEITGLTPENVAVKVHRIKSALQGALSKGAS